MYSRLVFRYWMRGVKTRDDQARQIYKKKRETAYRSSKTAARSSLYTKDRPLKKSSSPQHSKIRALLLFWFPQSSLAFLHIGSSNNNSREGFFLYIRTIIFQHIKQSLGLYIACVCFTVYHSQHVSLSSTRYAECFVTQVKCALSSRKKKHTFKTDSTQEFFFSQSIIDI